MRCWIRVQGSGRTWRVSGVGLEGDVGFAMAVGSTGIGSVGVGENGDSIGISGVIVAARGKLGLKRVCVALKALLAVWVAS